MQSIDIAQVQTHLLKLLERAANGEEVIITKENQPFVKLVPIVQSKPRPKYGSAKGLIEITEDFDKPLIAQAMAETIPIISKDAIFKQYDDIQMIW